jgi:hypothetical protein
MIDKKVLAAALIFTGFLSVSAYFYFNKKQIYSCADSGLKYLQDNPDVKQAGMDPWDHYIRFGQKEGRSWAGETC